MEMSRAKRIRILKDLQKTLMSIQCITYSDQPQALSDSIAEAELMEKVAEGMPKIKDCSDCKYINITETEQNRNESKISHICLLLNQRLLHLNIHPLLKPLCDCPVNETISLCQAYRVSRVGEIEKISFQVLTELEPVC